MDKDFKPLLPLRDIVKSAENKMIKPFFARK